MKPGARGHRRDSQRGYALLLVFLMAAIIALMLYQQLPRVAFESERDKEQLLIDRGEQYTRAIQLYYLANNRRYPTSIDDLEKQEKRFLRRRYVDPFTGKADWRIIHTNGGFLTDSLVQKPPTDDQSKSAGTTNNGTSTSPDNTTAANVPPQVNAAVLQRPSDRPVNPPGFGQPNIQGPSDQAGNTVLPPITLQPQQGQAIQPQQGQAALPPITLQPGSVNQPGGLPPITLAPIGAVGGPQIPGQNPGQLQTPGQNQGQSPGQLRTPQGAVAPFPGQAPGGLPGGIPGVPPGFRIDASGQLVPNAPVAPGQVGPGLTPGVPGQPPGIPGQPFTPQPPTSGPVQGSPSAALNAINQLLTTPRQVNGALATAPTTNQIGAIAGIASTHKGPSIKVYKDQSMYELWEFVFNPTASTVPGGGVGVPGPTPGNGPNGGQGQPGTLGAPSTFAPSGTFGPAGGQPPPGSPPSRQ